MKIPKKAAFIACGWILVGALLFGLGQIVPFAKTCETLRPKVLRLHIIGADNTRLAQNQKLAVRDALLANTDDWLGDATTKEQAMAALSNCLPQIQSEAEAALRRAGSEDAARVTVTKCWFPTKSYEDGTTLPAGEYDALQVRVGKAEGKNWWCMLFPDLCLPAAGDQGGGGQNITHPKVDRTTIFTPKEYEITQGGGFEVRLFVIEIWEWLRSKW